MLFSDDVRDDMQLAYFGENTYEFFNRSGRLAAIRIREKINEWLAAYPSEHRNDLVARFPAQFNSSFYELLIFTYLSSIAQSVECHPEVEDSDRRPDFRATFSDGTKMYVEATCTESRNFSDDGATAVENTILNEVNKVPSENFFVSIDKIAIHSEQQPTVRRFREYLRRLFDECDVDILEAQANHGHFKTEQFRDEGLEVDLTLFPVSPQSRGLIDRVVGSRPVKVFWGSGEDEVLSAIQRKATRYGKLGSPYIVAVNAFSLVEEVGGSLLHMLLGPANPENISESYEAPRFDPGAWRRSRGPVNTRVSGVLVTKLFLWNLFSSDIRLFHNPWSEYPAKHLPWQVPQFVEEEDRVIAVPGDSMGVILGIAEGWPGMLYE